MKALPGRKKILLYLHDKDEYYEDRIYPFSYCQEGIAQSVELSQNRVSSLLVDMEKNDLIDKESKRVKGASNKRYIYFLTEKGKKKVKRIKRDIEEKNIRIKTKNGIDEIKLGNIEDHVNGPNSYLFALNNLDKENILDLTDIGNEDIFVNREKEISIL